MVGVEGHFVAGSRSDAMVIDKSLVTTHDLGMWGSGSINVDKYQYGIKTRIFEDARLRWV